jgi:hypothetical protein
MGKVKTWGDLLEFVCKLRLSRKAVFTQEGNLIQHFLYQRHYYGHFFREYVRSSLLCILTVRSVKNFFDLGDVIRQLAYDYPLWDGGPAKAMLSFHLDKLLEIRQYAVSRKQLILQVYTYLRDAHAKDYYHESMAGALWARIGEFSMPSLNGGGGGKPPQNGGGGGNGGGVPEVTRCGWCNQKKLHRLYHVPGQRNVCPVKALTDKTKAREAAKWVVDQKSDDPSKDLQALLNSTLATFV